MQRQTTASKILGGVKAGIGLVMVLPFLIFLVPLWYFYRWSEVRAGRHKPDLPWAGIDLPAYLSMFNVPKRHSRASSAMRGAEEEFANPVNQGRAASGASAGALSGASGASEGGASSWQSTNVTREPEESSTSSTTAPLSTDITPPPLGSIALVTGGARHLGAAICEDLASLGYRVAVTYYRSKTPANNLVANIQKQGGDAQAFYLNQSDPKSITTLLQGVESSLGVPNLLINNASLFFPTAVDRSSWEELELLNRVNLQGPLWLAMLVANKMRQHHAEQGGQIIQLCDIWGEQPLLGYSAYCASKAGLLMATQGLAREVAPEVRVNAIAPGAIVAKEEQKGVDFQKMLSRTPLAKNASPDAVLQAVRYLLTARFVTGEILHVDGGRRLV